MSIKLRQRRARSFDFVNSLGKALGGAGIIVPNLGEANLLDAARAATGLDDFGDSGFLEPLRLLLRALEEEAELTLIGRLSARSYVLELLSNRLRLTRDRNRFGEIGEQKINQPLFVFGLPRTGTTLLHGLLAQDPANRTPLTWEVMSPSPPPRREDFETDPRIEASEKRLAWVNRLAPEFKTIHPVGARLPQECIAITTHAFASIQFHTTWNVPSYQRWLDGDDLKGAYDCHREFLQHLQWRCPGERWVLKAPAHLFGLPALLATYPDAGLVQTHRDPLVVAASIASHGTVLRRAFSDHVDPALVASQWNGLWCEGLERAIEARAKGIVPPDRVLDLHYREIVADPIGSVRRVYDHFSLSLSEDAVNRMRSFLEANPKDKHGRHRYTLEEFGLDQSAEEHRYAAYMDRFSIERERVKN